MSIKTNIMHYTKWTRVMLPVVFEEIEMVYIFFTTFFFSLSLSIGKLVKSQPLPPLPISTGLSWNDNGGLVAYYLLNLECK